MSWIYLGLAIMLEVAGTTCMKLSDGFSKLVPSVLILIFYGCSLSLFTISLKGINLNIAYAIWSGMGTSLIAIVGVYAFKETLTTLKIVSIGWIVIGVIGLNLTRNN